MEAINAELLKKIADILKKNQDSLMGSRWQNIEAEVIATQAICSCFYNYKKTGDSFTWANKNVASRDLLSGVDNGSALSRLISEGSVIMETYSGNADCPQNTLHIDGAPQILRVTNELLEYVDQFVS
ncbi:MAG: hypothetical protein WCW61_01925 [Patescibacteria group bacterium]